MRARVLFAVSLFLVLSAPNLFFLPVYTARIFSDGFENGSLNAWSGSTTSGTGTILASTDYAHQGSYSGKANIQATNDVGGVYEFLTQGNGPFYGRAYFYLTALYIPNNRGVAIQSFVRNGYSSRLSSVKIYNFSGTYRFQLEYYDNAAYSVITNTAISVQFNQWYCIEEYILRNDMVGAASMWIDGVLSASAIGLNNTGYAYIGQYHNGLQGNAYTAGQITIYVDDAVIDSSYIGPTASDTTAPTYSNTSTNTTVADNPCSFNCLVSDDTNVSTYIFSTNNTGVWTNDSATTFSNFFNTTAAWVNVTKTLNGTIGNVVSYLWYANDTNNNWSNSEQVNLTVRERPDLQITPDNVTCRKYLETFNLQINVTNAVDIQAFNFTIYYDPSLLNCSSVTSGELAHAFTVTLDTANGILEGKMAGSPMNGNHWLLNITFQAAEGLIWKEGLANKLESRIWFHQAEVGFSDNSTLKYVEGGVNQINVNQMAYTFLPIRGDVNNDGTVNIQDIRTVAAYYGKTMADPEWPEASKYDLTNDNTIDIFDLILVATNFGFTYP